MVVLVLLATIVLVLLFAITTVFGDTVSSLLETGDQTESTVNKQKNKLDDLIKESVNEGQESGGLLGDNGDDGASSTEVPGGTEGCALPANALVKSNFDTGWKDAFNTFRKSGTVSTVSDGAYNGKSLRVHIPGGAHYGTGIRYNFKKAGQSEPEELNAQYLLKFGENFHPKGGKLPGFAGTYGKAGWGSRKPTGTNGWAVRGGFSPGDTGVQIGFYNYHMDMGRYGSNYHGGDLELGTWYCVKQYIKLNTPGRKDGVLKMWVNGEQIVDEGNIRWRTTRRIKIEEYWFNIYYGGSWSAPQSMNIYFDNFAVWKP